MHYHSISGRKINQFCRSTTRSELVHDCQATVVFPPGCTWLVCAVETDGSGGVTDVYLREIELGLNATSITLWLDDRLLRKKRERFRYCFNDWNRDNGFTEDGQVIDATHGRQDTIVQGFKEEEEVKGAEKACGYHGLIVKTQV